MLARHAVLFLATLLLAAQLRPTAFATEPQRPERIDTLHLLPGFAAQRLYAVPREQQGSWVSLARGPNGSLFASDQGEAGIYKITPARLGDAADVTLVERIDVPVSGAQGLCYHRGVLYANVNGKGPGVWAIRDTDGDGTFDATEHILPLKGAGEHGPHAVFPTPDGEHLIVMGGNYTQPAKLTASRLPSNWKEDFLLPRQWDARGHAKGLLAPGGWIARMRPDGTEFEILSVGYRNTYDAAFSPEGELFTYDSDLEWDMGAPWYRPTRICHVLSGSEFGWRSGTGKWPSYYEDSLPSVLDIGPGSPVGVTFGTGARFPTRYQRALFALDWTFGTIHCIHLKPNGASYTGEEEEFVSGSPLPVTDALIGEDGAFYFTTGGRGTESALWRVFYEGDEETTPAGKGTITHAAEKRRALEKFHGRKDPRAVDAVWDQLGSSDRFVRYAARVAIENQPVREWQRRALAETEPQRAIVALMALCRQGDKSLQADLFSALMRIDFDALPLEQKLALLRSFGLCFMRLGSPSESQRNDLISMLDEHFPTDDDDVNVELARLLVYLDAPTVISKALALMESADPPQVPQWGELIARNEEYGSPIAKMLENYPPLLEIQYAFLLRNLRWGWTTAERRRYFRWFLDVAKHPGGLSFAGFLENIRSEALANCSAAERAAVADLTGQEILPQPTITVTAPEGPGRDWTLAEAIRATEGSLTGRDFEKGKNLFHATSCVKCHRFDGTGGDVGPDLTSLAARLSLKDLLENIIEPSRVISDQYGSTLITTADGKELLGRLVDRRAEDPDGTVRFFTQDPDAAPLLLREEDIEQKVPSPISQMPLGLLKPLSAEELRDLVAYLLSRGNPSDARFAKPETDKEKSDGAKASGAKAPASTASEEAAVRKFRFEYSGSIDEVPPGARVRVWLPLPRQDAAQEVSVRDVKLPGKHRPGTEERYGNKMVFTETTARGSASIPFRLSYDITRKELLGGSGTKISEKDRKLFLSPNRLVPVGEKPGLIAADWPDSTDPLERSLAIYEGVLQHMQYDKSRPGFGRGDARWACESRFGNCTDFHSLFISIARGRKVPSRFEMGFPLPGDAREGTVGGYHCWAHFYVDGKGWIPLDISEADKHPSLRRYYFGNLSADRFSLSRGRDLVLSPPQSGPPLNYFVYPYVEVDGEVWPQEKIEKHFRFRDL